MPEPARSAGSCSQKNILVGYFFFAPRSHLGLEKIDKAPRGENRWAAGADIDQLFPGIEVRTRDVRERLGVVIQIVKDALDKPLMLPRESPKEDGGLFSLFANERSRLVGRVVLYCRGHNLASSSQRPTATLTCQSS